MLTDTLENSIQGMIFVYSVVTAIIGISSIPAIRLNISNRSMAVSMFMQADPEITLLSIVPAEFILRSTDDFKNFIVSIPRAGLIFFAPNDKLSVKEATSFEEIFNDVDLSADDSRAGRGDFLRGFDVRD